MPAGVPAGTLAVLPPLQATEASNKTTANPKAAVIGRRRKAASVKIINAAINDMSHALPKWESKARGLILIVDTGGTEVRSAVPTVSKAFAAVVVLGVTGEG